MIRQLKIVNFQSHKDTCLVFHPGVNVIIGSSHKGKTSILRALKLVAQNRPSGDDYRSHWAVAENEDTVITVENQLGSVTRTKGKKTNEYQVGDSEPYKAMGRDVPEVVRDTLNLDVINWKEQYDEPFFLSLTPGKAAQKLNEYMDMSIIDRSIQHMKSGLLEGGKNIKHYESDLLAVQDRIDSFPDVDLMGLELAALLKEDAAVQEKDAKWEEINDLVGVIAALEKKIGKQDWTKALKELQVLFEEAEQIHTLEQEQQSLGIAMREILTTDIWLETTTKELTKAQADFKEAFPDICPLCGATQ